MNLGLEVLYQLVVIALLVEAVVTNLKPLWDKTKGFQIDIIIALVVSIAVCVLVGIDVFKLVNLPMIVPYVGSVLTGIIISRGANALHELIASLEILRSNWKAGVSLKLPN